MLRTLKASLPFKLSAKRLLIFYCLAKLTVTLVLFGLAYLYQS